MTTSRARCGARHLRRCRAVPTEGVEPLDHPLPLTDVLRDDVPAPGLSRYEALCGAPDATKDAFRVPQVRPGSTES